MRRTPCGSSAVEALAQLDTLLQSTFLAMFGDPVRSGWTMVTAEAVDSNQSGAFWTGPFGSQLLHSEFVDEGVRVLGIDYAVANEFQEGEPRFITAHKHEQLRRYTVRPRDVLITIMGTCGRNAVVPDDICTAINTKHLCCITLDRGKCLPEFMHAYFLEHPIARRYLDRNAKGAIMSGLNMRIIKALPIPAAPLDLQHRFAAIVQSVERQKDQRQRAHFDRARQPFRLPAGPRLQGRPLSRHGHLHQLRVPEAGVPACGGERDLCGAPRLRRPAGLLLPRTTCAGAPSPSVSTQVEKTLSPPKVTNLDAYLGEPAFRALVPEVVWQKAEYIRQAGNVAVHGNKTPAPEHALDVVRELAHVLYWAGSHLSAEGSGEPPGEDLRRVTRPHGGTARGARQRRGTGRPQAPTWTPPRTRARTSKASWRRCVSGSPPSRRRTTPSPRRVTGTRPRPAG